MARNIRKRFRKEVRAREDILPGATVVLDDSEERRCNARAAKLLLVETFGEHITVEFGPDGLVCGSREEAGALRLMEYTTGRSQERDVFLSSITREEIETYLKEETGEECEVYVPDTPEARLIDALAEEFPDVRYGV